MDGRLMNSIRSEQQIASIRRDGTLRKPTTIWLVRVADDLYVQSAYGTVPPGSVAPRPATKVESGQAGVEKDLTFLEAAPQPQRPDRRPRTAPSTAANEATYVKPEARSTTRAREVVQRSSGQAKLMLSLSPASPALSSSRNKAARSAARVLRRTTTMMPLCGLCLAN